MRTRKGDTFDEVRVPIPTSKLERAEALIEFLVQIIKKFKNSKFEL